jgi:O-antigen biosynthesis protein WbqP
MLKRLLDLALALILILPASIIIVFVAIWIKLDSDGPVLFKQIRVGKHKKHFTIIKLRTMDNGTGDRASHETTPSQITRAGKILRMTKIDELPQIWLVLIGDMSFVGPRPCLPIQIDLIEARSQLNVFSVLPGITGPAQIANIDMSNPSRLAEIDGQYVVKKSFYVDLACIFATVFGKGFGDVVK